MDEAVVRHRFWLLAYNFGVPKAQEIGQDEIVSSTKLEALDAAGHDAEVFVEGLADKSPTEAIEAFLGFRDRLETKALRNLPPEEFQSRFLRGIK